MNSTSKQVFIDITEKVINIAELITFCKNAKSGALSVFIGTTRDFFENKKVKLLEYECHKSMALKELEKLVDEAILKYNLISAAVVHRIGEVPVMEESIVIVTSSECRDNSINASKYLIDAVKKSVPIWKKEIYEDGNSKWKENDNSIHKLN